MRVDGWHGGREARLLLACARTTLTAQNADVIKEALQGVDWNAFLHLTSAQSALPLVGRSLLAAAPDAVSTAVQAEIVAERQHTADSNQFLLTELITTLQLFASHGIKALTYKGPILAQTLYGDMTLRLAFDVDILVHPCDYDRATALLLAQGFRVTMQMSWKCHLQRPRLRGDAAGRGAGPLRVEWVDVDLHRAFVPIWYGFATRFDDLWERRRIVAGPGFELPTLSNEDLLIMLCLDLAKDIARGFQARRLLKVTDIFELLNGSADIEWNQVAHRADAARARQVVALGLLVVDRYYGIPMKLPPRTSWFLRPLVRRSQPHILRSESEALLYAYPRLNQFSALLRLQQSWRGKVALVWTGIRLAAMAIRQQHHPG